MNKILNKLNDKINNLSIKFGKFLKNNWFIITVLVLLVFIGILSNELIVSYDNFQNENQSSNIEQELNNVRNELNKLQIEYNKLEERIVESEEENVEEIEKIKKEHEDVKEKLLNRVDTINSNLGLMTKKYNNKKEDYDILEQTCKKDIDSLKNSIKSLRLKIKKYETENFEDVPSSINNDENSNNNDNSNNNETINDSIEKDSHNQAIVALGLANNESILAKSKLDDIYRKYNAHDINQNKRLNNLSNRINLLY